MEIALVCRASNPAFQLDSLKNKLTADV